MNHSLSLQLNSNDTGTIVKRLHVWMAQMKPQKEDCSICTSAICRCSQILGNNFLMIVTKSLLHQQLEAYL